MNILLGSAVSDEIKERYICLPLDTFYIKSLDQTETAYCIIENVPILEMMAVENDVDLHNQLINQYQQMDWEFCKQAIQQLMGRWDGEIDTFYADLLERVNAEKDDNWSPIIVKD